MSSPYTKTFSNGCVAKIWPTQGSTILYDPDDNEIRMWNSVGISTFHQVDLFLSSWTPEPTYPDGPSTWPIGVYKPRKGSAVQDFDRIHVVPSSDYCDRLAVYTSGKYYLQAAATSHAYSQWELI